MTFLNWDLIEQGAAGGILKSRRGPGVIFDSSLN